VVMSESEDGRGCEKLRNEATRSFVFSENMKRGVHGGLLVPTAVLRREPHDTPTTSDEE
jgi:hypothetical protein